MWPACVFSWRNTTRNITRAYQFSNSPIASDLPLILTNNISPSPGDIMTRRQVRGWPGDNRLTSDVLWSPNSGPCPFTPVCQQFPGIRMFERLGEICANKEVYLTDLDHDEVIRSSEFCCPWLSWSGPGFVLVVPQPGRLPAPAPSRRERGRETGENIKHFEGIIPIFWSWDEYLLIPNFLLSLSHPDSTFLLPPDPTFIPKLHRHDRAFFSGSPKGKVLACCLPTTFYLYILLFIYIYNLCNCTLSCPFVYSYLFLFYHLLV